MKHDSSLLSEYLLSRLSTHKYSYSRSADSVEIFDKDRDRPPLYKLYNVITWIATAAICIYIYKKDQNGKNFGVGLFFFIGCVVSFIFYALDQSTKKYNLTVRRDSLTVRLPRKKALIRFVDIKQLRITSDTYDFNQGGWGGNVKLYSINCTYRNDEILLINFSDRDSIEAFAYAKIFQEELEKLIKKGLK